MTQIKQNNTARDTVILFDGICNFCNRSVNFMIDKDNKNRFKFAALQSEAGEYFLQHFKLDSENLKTIILIENNKYYIKTTAALKIAKQLKGLWKLFYVFIIIPPFIRNIFYDIIAKYRYKWFGKRDTCRVPIEGEKARFLE
jgi:predicted DCC family thiol-disulfide oxidoreductase YuxK